MVPLHRLIKSLLSSSLLVRKYHRNVNGSLTYSLFKAVDLSYAVQTEQNERGQGAVKDKMIHRKNAGRPSEK